MNNFEKNFLELAQEQKLIRIPGIQRDYAEGRQNTRVCDIRKTFLNELLKVVYGGAKLHLDFVYGYTKEGAFEPLDGQQRLTTLFLLYWYFCPTDKLTNLQNNNNYAILSYATRQSTIDFCNELVQHSSSGLLFLFNEYNNGKSQKEQITLSQHLQKMGWFKWQWRYDPSICSMLIVIEEIANLIKDNNYPAPNAQCYENLSNISFNLLPLDEFNMGDELYVKMNARGKQLSSFDIMKSVLEEEIQLQKLSGTEVEKNWREAIDGDWINYFWQKYCDGKTAEEMQKIDYRDVESQVEMQLKRLIQRMICIQFYNRENIDNAKWMIGEQDNFDKVLTIYCDLAWKYRVIDKNEQFPEKLDFNRLISDINILFYSDKENQKNRMHNVTELLDIEWLLNKNFLDEYMKEPQRDLQVAFYAMVAFLRLHSAKDINSDSILRQDFNDWMRFVRNVTLLRNTVQQIDKPERQKEAVAALETILEEYKGSNSTMREVLTDIKYVKGLENATLDEEKIKFNLRKDKEWKEAIDQLEYNEYLWGQIIAPLKWSMENNIPNLQKFKRYSEKLQLLFPIKDPRKFRAALLCITNYGTWKRSGNDLFLCEDNYQRDRSFKNFLRNKESNYGEVIKTLINIWNKQFSSCATFEQFFEALKARFFSQIIQDWRRYIILAPNILSFACNSKLWFNEQTRHMFLRQKQQSDTQRREIFLAYLNDTIKETINHILHDWYPEERNQNSIEIPTYNVQITLAPNGLYKYSDSNTQEDILSSIAIIEKLNALNILK